MKIRSRRWLWVAGVISVIAFACSSQDSNPASNTNDGGANDGGVSPSDDGSSAADGSIVTDSGRTDADVGDGAPHLLSDAGLRVGAWVNPTTDAGFPPTTLGGLETYLGRKVDFSLQYQPMTDSFPTPAETDDDTNGRITVISMVCNVADVPGATTDTEFNARLAEYKSYGKPIVLRYCWEMNEHAGAPIAAADFITAWRHLHDLAVAANVTNLYWFFCPARETGAAYYPGDGYVDYAGWDVYDRDGGGLENTLAPPYEAYAAIEKPFIVGETAAKASLDQPTFLDGTSRATLSSKFPKIVGIDYFDGAGAIDWSFTDAGVASFKKFAN